ncbi:unnamed protein product [Pleuronectes platessa]|uniref:Uncharacterized protein n=1 Tax=Pleuronectes platessa TaxID=8262 RepID=A0A9N7YAP2_PLEPL|nr:unnamed protein product [Pleuronectes platessa]
MKDESFERMETSYFSFLLLLLLPSFSDYCRNREMWTKETGSEAEAVSHGGICESAADEIAREEEEEEEEEEEGETIDSRRHADLSPPPPPPSHFAPVAFSSRAIGEGHRRRGSSVSLTSRHFKIQ